MKWHRKAVTIRQAIDAYREKVDAPPITRRQKFSALVEGLAEQMSPRSQPVPRPAPVMPKPQTSEPAREFYDHKARAAGE
jgi:hypothetical protein